MTREKKKHDRTDAYVNSRPVLVKRKEGMKEQADWYYIQLKELLRNDITEIL